MNIKRFGIIFVVSFLVTALLVLVCGGPALTALLVAGGVGVDMVIIEAFRMAWPL